MSSKKIKKENSRKKMPKEEKTVSEEKRKQNEKILNYSFGFAIGCGAAYVLSYTATIMEEESVLFMQALSIFMEHFNEAEYLFIPNLYGIFGMLVGVAVGIIAAFFLQSESSSRYSFDPKASAGTGGFMDKKQLVNYSLKYVDEQPYEDPANGEIKVDCNPNMILGDGVYRSLDARITNRNNNILVIGGSGTGKSYGFIKPNILQMNASFVCTDPAGELVRSLGKVLREHGYKIKIFNIVDMRHSNTYNPFNYIREESDVLNMVDCFIKNTTSKEEGTGEKFWVDSEKLLYSACIFYLRDHCDDFSKKNFSAMLEMINSASVDESGKTKIKSELDKKFDKLPADSLALKYYKAFMQSPSKTRMSIIISCLTRLQPFMMKNMANLTKTDEMELNKIGDEKTALFIITPQSDNNPYNFLASMLYSQLFDTLYYQGIQKGLKTGSESLTYPVRCLMDEFANIGSIPGFASKLSTMRKYNISASVVIQDLAQLKYMYKDEWETLMANCDGILFLGTSAQETLKYISEQLGYKTIREKSTGRTFGARGSSTGNWKSSKREVMTPEEVGRLPNDEVIVFTRGERPIRCKKYKGNMHPLWKQTEGENNIFRFNTMDMYDNQKMSEASMGSVLKAKMEAARFHEKFMIHKVEDIREIGESDLNELLNSTGFPKEQEEKLFSILLMECIQKISAGTSTVKMDVIENIAPKKMEELARQAAFATGADQLVLLADNHSKEIYGVAVDQAGNRLTGMIKENQYVMEIEAGNEILLFKIKSEDLKLFVQMLEETQDNSTC